MTQGNVTYTPSEEVDFVIVGSGAAGGVLAKELSTNGFRVVVLEQGPYLHEKDFTHDEVKVFTQNLLTNHPKQQPVTFRKTPQDAAKTQQAVLYGNCVGGSSVHFTANYWRLHEIDFIEHSKSGDIAGANCADWPTSNPPTRKSTGKSASRVLLAQVQLTRRAPSRIPCRPCL